MSRCDPDMEDDVCKDESKEPEKSSKLQNIHQKLIVKHNGLKKILSM